MWLIEYSSLYEWEGTFPTPREGYSHHSERVSSEEAVNRLRHLMGRSGRYGMHHVTVRPA